MAPLELTYSSDSDDDETESVTVWKHTYLRVLCNVDTITDRGKRIQLMKMVILVISPMAVLLGLTCYFLDGSTWERKEMRKQKEALIYSTDLGQFIHSLQKERDQSALYLSAIGPDTKLYLLERYTETDEHLHTLSSWPVDLVEDIAKNKRVQFRDKFTFQIYMNNHRNSLDVFNTTDYKEIQFYTNNINILIKWMYNAITLANRVGGIWKSMVAYQKLLACKENAGVERALGSIFFTRGGFEDHEYYLWYVRKVHTFHYGFHTARTYSKIIQSMDYYNHKQTRVQNLSTIIDNYRHVITNRSAYNPSLTRATQFYDNMTLYLDQLYEIQITVAQNIEEKFQENEQRSTKDVVLAFVIIIVVVAAIPIQILSVHRHTSDIQSYALTLVDKTNELDVEKERTESLVYKMLPKYIALQLKNRRSVHAELFTHATVMLSEIHEFGRLSKEYTPLQLINLLEEMFHVFDSKAKIYDVYKVEHIVDQCIVVSGVPKRNGRQHATEIADMALDLMKSIETLQSTSIPREKILLQIGIHTGPVMAGILGSIVPKYSLFGDTVNMASKIVTTGLANRIHVSATTFKILNKYENFTLICRGCINIKLGKYENEEMLTYWMNDNSENLGRPPTLFEEKPLPHCIDVKPKRIRNNENQQPSSTKVQIKKSKSNYTSSVMSDSSYMFEAFEDIFYNSDAYDDLFSIIPDHSVKHKRVDDPKGNEYVKTPRVVLNQPKKEKNIKEKNEKKKKKMEKKNPKQLSHFMSDDQHDSIIHQASPQMDNFSIRSTSRKCYKDKELPLESRNTIQIKEERHNLKDNDKSVTDQIYSCSIVEHLPTSKVPDKNVMELESFDDMPHPAGYTVQSCITPVDYDMVLIKTDGNVNAKYDSMKEETETEGRNNRRHGDDMVMLETHDYRKSTVDRLEKILDSSLPPITDQEKNAIQILDTITADVTSDLTIQTSDTDMSDVYGSPC